MASDLSTSNKVQPQGFDFDFSASDTSTSPPIKDDGSFNAKLNKIKTKLSKNETYKKTFNFYNAHKKLVTWVFFIAVGTVLGVIGTVATSSIIETQLTSINDIVGPKSINGTKYAPNIDICRLVAVNSHNIVIDDVKWIEERGRSEIQNG
jgi:hypothetical protein